MYAKHTTNLQRRIGFFLVVAAISTAWTAITPVAVAALSVVSDFSGSTFVVGPTGVDDTYNLQTAFDKCTESGPGCTVLLNPYLHPAGPQRFYVSQVIAKGFDGQFRGVNKAHTIIDVPGPKSVPNYTPPDFDPLPGEEDESPGSASMIIFEGGGNIAVSDMTFDITAKEPAEKHPPKGGLPEYEHVLDRIMYVTYRPPETASVDEGVSIHNVEFKSLRDPTIISYDTNVRVGIRIGGASITLEDEMPISTPITGTHSVTNCEFHNQGIGVESAGLVDGEIHIGGGFGSGNEMIGTDFGILVLDSSNALFEISHNNVVASGKSYSTGIWGMQRRGMPRTDRGEPFVRAPDIPSRAIVSYNTVIGASNAGVYVFDHVFESQLGQALKAYVEGNIIFQQESSFAGIYARVIQSSRIRLNTIEGPSLYGIWLYRCLQNVLVRNSNLDSLTGIKLSESVNNHLRLNSVARNEERGYHLVNSRYNKLVNNYAVDSGDGFRFESSNHNILRQNIATENRLDGFHFVDSNQNRLWYNQATLNGESGFYFENSRNNVIYGNEAEVNMNGFLFDGSKKNCVMKSFATGNAVDGIHLVSSDNNTFWIDLATGNDGSGFHLEGSHNNTFVGSTASGNINGFLLEQSDDNVMRHNDASDNADYGFALLDYSSLNKLKKNWACGNDIDAIQDETSTDNKFFRNMFCRISGID